MIISTKAGGGAGITGAAQWGLIAGTLSDQTDLSLVLSGKSAVGHIHNLSDLTEDTTHRLVTDTEKNTWNAKQDAGSYEVTTNKVTSISGSSTDVQYPSAKLLYDQLAGKQPTGAYLTSVTVDSPLSGAGTAASHLTVDLSSKQNASTNLTSLAGLTYVSASFVKMTAANTFTLDTNTYLTSLSGAVLTDQTTPQTVGDTDHRLNKLWTTDITCTNAITGSVTGNAGTATTLATTRAINGVNFDGSAAITVPVNNVDDVATNATVYLLWTATAGGNYAAKVSTTKLYFNPSTGMLTATGFTGPLTGTASGNLTSASTLDASKLSGTIPSAVLGNSSLYIGTTSVDLNRASNSLSLTGVSIDGNAATVTTNANLTGPITSVGNATSIASQTGTGTKFVVDNSPTIVTPTIASLIGNKIYPAADSTSAILFNKADGTTNIVTIDTTNSRVGIGITVPVGILHLATTVGSNLYIDTYSSTDANPSILTLRKSSTSTIGTVTTTTTGEEIGRIDFRGVDSGNNFDLGAQITVNQNGAAGTRVPCDMFLETWGSSAKNTGQLTLLNSGYVGIGSTVPAYTLDVNGLGVLGSNAAGTSDTTTENHFSIFRGCGITSGGHTYGSYGGFILNSNATFSASARRFLITNALYGYYFGIIRSVDATTNPSLTTLGAINSGIADFVIKYDGSIGIGSTSPVTKVDLADGTFSLTDADVAHGMTSNLPTNVYGSFQIYSATNGGLNLIGVSDTDATALVIQGYMGSDNPTDSTPAIVFSGSKKNSATIQALGAAETVYQFKNYTTDLVTILGSGYVGIGTTTPIAPLDVRSGTGIIVGTRPTVGETHLRNWRTGDSSSYCLGTLYSSGATSLGYFVKPDTGVANGYLGAATVTVSPASMEFQNGYIRFLGAASQSLTKDSAVTLTEWLRIKSDTGNIGIGSTAPTAYLNIKAGSATASTAPIKLTSGTVNTNPEAGAIEYNNTFHVVNSDATRRHIVTAVSATKTTAAAPYTNDGYITINIGGTDVKVMTTA